MIQRHPSVLFQFATNFLWDIGQLPPLWIYVQERLGTEYSEV